MKRKKQKNYWVKKKEAFVDGKKAKSRAASLRSHEHVSHVTVTRTGDDHVVSYSVAKWFLDQAGSAGIDIQTRGVSQTRCS